MTELWVLLGGLLLPLAAVIAWPLWRRRKQGQALAEEPGVDAAARKALFLEHKGELDAAQAAGSLSEDEYQAMHAELARKFLQEEGAGYRLSRTRQGGRGLLFALAFAVPFAAVGLYLHWGAYGDLALYRDIMSSHSGDTDIVAEASITQRLRERAQTHPQDLTSRYVLAQRLLVSNDIKGAVEQYRYIVAHEPEAANVRAEFAQALFFASGSKITPEVAREVEVVLQAQPNNGTALGLAGIAAFESGEFARARDHWQRALTQMTPGSNAYQALSAGVARAQQALAEAGGDAGGDAGVEGVAPESGAAVAATAGSEADSALGPNAIRIRVTLAEAAGAPGDTPVFVYARTAESPMPLAIVRLKAADLPTEVVLDESRAMMPGRSLKTVDSVQLVARLAVGGNARPAPGDWQGGVEALPRSAWGETVAIAIDEQI